MACRHSICTSGTRIFCSVKLSSANKLLPCQTSWQSLNFQKVSIDVVSVSILSKNQELGYTERCQEKLHPKYKENGCQFRHVLLQNLRRSTVLEWITQFIRGTVLLFSSTKIQSVSSFSGLLAQSQSFFCSDLRYADWRMLSGKGWVLLEQICFSKKF